MKEREEPRPYYVPPKKSISLQVIGVVVKPLRIGPEGTTYQLVIPNPPKSEAAKMTVDNEKK